MGYCLIPSTKAQKMLFLTGKGGEGKSRIGLVMQSLLGNNMNTGSIAKVETSPFARADLEHELCRAGGFSITGSAALPGLGGMYPHSLSASRQESIVSLSIKSNTALIP